MALMAYFMFALFQGVAMVHVGWAFGLSWPAKSRDELGPMVVGTPRGIGMPAAWLTLAVALIISSLGGVALWASGVISLGALDAARGWVSVGIAVVLVARGALTFLPFGPLRASEEPFRSLDRRFFGPFILLLAAGFLSLSGVI